MLSKEELEHVSELQKGGMTDYQKESMDYYKMESEYRSKIKDLGKERAEDNGYLRAVHTERLDKETQSSLLKSEAEKKVAEHKLAEDDIKGLVYDEQL